MANNVLAFTRPAEESSPLDSRFAQLGVLKKHLIARYDIPDTVTLEPDEEVDFGWIVDGEDYYEVTNELIGALQYGPPMNSKSTPGSLVFGSTANEMYELNRMAMLDDAPKLCESQAIG